MENAVSESMLVAIDGPAGSGKSSVSREAASQLGFGILDTGAAYRALAWAALEAGVHLDDEEQILELLDRWRYKITLLGEQQVTVALSDTARATDVTALIRTTELSGQVSRVSKHPAVRERLNAMFRELVATSGLPGVVIEGRDITTVVAPNAPVRILMTASPEVRAARRAGELQGLTREQVLADIEARDAKDTLVVDFMNPAPGVTLVDTSTQALNLAKQNAITHGVDVKIVQNDLLRGYGTPVDIILANLPYVDRAWEVSPETHAEPELALYAKDDGLALIRQLINQAEQLLTSNGVIILESDERQQAAIIQLASEHGLRHQATEGLATQFIKKS